MENIEDHKLLRKNLETAKDVTIIGVNLNSMETASTLQKEYPNLKRITMVEENNSFVLSDQLGHELADKIVE